MKAPSLDAAKIYKQQIALDSSIFIHVASPVKPNPPEKLTVVIREDNSYPFLRVSWEPPHKADTRSGWITLIYEIRVKLEGRNDWEVRTCFGLSALNLLFIKIHEYPSDADRFEGL